MTTTGSAIRLPLNRPEYVTVPEAFITSIAWKVYDSPALTAREDNRPVGLYFRGSKPNGKNVGFRSTDPSEGQLALLAASLTAAGLVIEDDAEQLAAAVLNSVLGIRVERSDIQPASPISPSFALLQNTRGLLRKQNPPDIAEILQSMYSFGLPAGMTSPGVAGRWQKAAMRRIEIDPLIAGLDAAVDSAIVRREERATPPQAGAAELQGFFQGTPFEWFTTSWDRLTDDAWVEALPARVWVDWATTLLRLAFGTGFLWESSWHLAFAREVLRDEPVRPLADVQASVGEVVPWVSSRAGTAARDIAPKLSRKVYQGELVRRALDDWLTPHRVDGRSFVETVTLMREDGGLQESLLEALRSNERVNSGQNLWEATKYALMTRDVSGQSPDYYGLLQSRGRFLTVSPGIEWIAVIASLACGDPGGTTDVGNVLHSLEKLGLRPELSDLIALLERAGMARGSADADSGVLVESAF